MQAWDAAALYLASDNREQKLYLATALALLREQGATQSDQMLTQLVLTLPALNPMPAAKPLPP